MGTTTQKKARRAPKDPNESPQRARKRALDRQAQRTFREKTKNYVAHLEQTVEACKAENEEQLITNLMDQNSQLHHTIESLRKTIGDINACSQRELSSINSRDCRTDSEDASQAASGSPSPSHAAMASAAMGTVAPALSAFTELDQHESVEQANRSGRDKGVQEVHHDQEPEISHEVFGANDIVAEHSTDALVFEASSNDLVISKQRHGRDGTRYGTQDFHPEFATTILKGASTESWLPGGIHVPMPITPSPDLARWDLWTVTNSVLNKMFTISLEQAPAARGSDRSAIFKAIKDGWDTLSEQEQSNPVLQILREYDTIVCNLLDKVSRVAIAYKNFLLIKYYLNPDTNDLKDMPPWFRPSQSQRSRKHPVVIDFFAWPGFREALIHEEISIESAKFSMAYVENFRFLWPFSFEDTFQYQQSTGELIATPLFERYHRDLRFWSMDERFFSELPQLVEYITPRESPVSSVTATTSNPAEKVYPADCWLMDVFHSMPDTA